METWTMMTKEEQQKCYLTNYLQQEAIKDLLSVLNQTQKDYYRLSFDRHFAKLNQPLEVVLPKHLREALNKELEENIKRAAATKERLSS